MAVVIKSYGGVPVGSTGTPYDLHVSTDTDWRLQSRTVLRDRLGDAPIQDGQGVLPRELRCELQPGSTANADRDAWWRIAAGVFRADGVARPLVVEWENADYRVMASVIDLGNYPNLPMSASADVARVLIFQMADPAWEAVATTTDSSSPLTNAGNTVALPVITITPITSTLNHARATITDTLNSGAHAYPVMLTFDGQGVGATTAADFIVFCNHREIPFTVRDPNTATTDVIVDLDIPQAGGSVTVDIYFGSSISNTLTASQLPAHGRAFTDSNWSNTNWVWTFDNILHTHADNISGVWYPGNTGAQFSDKRGFITSQSGGSLVFTLQDPASALITDLAYDSMIMIVGGAVAGASSALSGLSRATASMTNNGRAFVRYLVPGDLAWRDAWTTTSDGTVTTAVDLDNAFVIAVGIEPNVSASTGELTLSASGDFALALASNPTVSVATPVTARKLDHRLVNLATGDVIRFGHPDPAAASVIHAVYLDDVDLVIDCEQRGAIRVESGQLYGEITPSNKALVFPLEPGLNAWANSAGENEITNPSGESGTTGWTDDGDTTITVETGAVRPGTRASLKLTSDTNNETLNAKWSHTISGTTTGWIARAGGWVYVPAGSNLIGKALLMTVRESGGAEAAAETDTSHTLVVGWQFVAGLRVIAESDRTAIVADFRVLDSEGPDAGDVLYLSGTALHLTEEALYTVAFTYRTRLAV
ncbi:MAG: hypothetical protein AB7R89_16175 [Dehalococcoidia bacterium]